MLVEERIYQSDYIDVPSLARVLIIKVHDSMANSYLCHGETMTRTWVLFYGIHENAMRVFCQQHFRPFGWNDGRNM